MIPAIESGWVESIHSFGGEVGMEKYIAARPDVFFVGKDGTMRSNRTLSQAAGQYAIDMFIGSTLQLDYEGNSSTVTKDVYLALAVRLTWDIILAVVVILHQHGNHFATMMIH